jgi:spore coat-associated protein N
MTRIATLRRRPWRVLGALACVLVAVGLAVGSGANYSSASANPTNTFDSGTLTQSNSKDGVAILTATNMKPGDSATGSVTITNTGSLAGTFSLSKSNLTDPITGTGGVKLSDQLDLKIEDTTGSPTTPPVVYNGKLSAMGTLALDYDPSTAGTQDPFVATNGARTYKFTVTLPSSTTNSYQGTSTSVEYDWAATQ